MEEISWILYARIWKNAAFFKNINPAKRVLVGV
jgi:hypothetical protein